MFEPLRTVTHCVAVLALCGLSACATKVDGSPEGPRLDRIKHVVVIYAENHSFDSLYGLFPGTNGISRATPEQMTQLDHDGRALTELLVFGANGQPDASYPRMPNKPFRMDAPPVNRGLTQMALSPTHLFYNHQEQINGGKNNMFVAMSAVGGWTMGHFDGSSMRLWQWAKEYTLADNFFQGAFGGSYLNHQYLICACAPRFENAPAHMVARLDANGKLEKRADSPSAALGAPKMVSRNGGQVTPDGYSVNSTQPPYQPSGVPPAVDGPRELADPKGHSRHDGDPDVPLPPQTASTIGDRLSAKGVSWAWYAGGFNRALVDGMQDRAAPRQVIYKRGSNSPNFVAHHQPFNYYQQFAPGSAARAQHLLDGDDFMRAIETGQLPQVSYYQPAGVNTQHPEYADVMTGDAHMAGILEKLRASPQWKDMLVIVAYDENGGYWDHVPPPTGEGLADRFGPGSRIPVLLIGPHVKKNFIDSTLYDTTSILKFLTRRFQLEPLAGARAKMGDLTGALN